MLDFKLNKRLIKSSSDEGQVRSVKIKIELNPDLDDDDTSITIHAKAVTPEVEQIYRQLQGINKHPDQIEGKKENVSYYLSMNEILFFETEDKQVIAHTARDAFTVDYKLYELENLLSNQFMRVSKSTILIKSNLCVNTLDF